MHPILHDAGYDEAVPGTIELDDQLGTVIGDDLGDGVRLHPYALIKLF